MGRKNTKAEDFGVRYFPCLEPLLLSSLGAEMSAFQGIPGCDTRNSAGRYHIIQQT